MELEDEGSDLSGRGAPLLSGLCHVLFAYDVGMGIDLAAAARAVEAAPSLGALDQRRPRVRHVDFRHVPLRLVQRGRPFPIGRFTTTPEVDLVLFDFGAVSLTYRIALSGPLGEVLDLSALLDEDPALFRDSRRRVQELLAAMGPAVSRPRLSELVEDYRVFQLPVTQAEGPAPSAIIGTERPLLAQILRSERRALSPHEIDDALASRIGYEAGDEAVIDWNAALLFQRETEGDRAVLEYANVQLLELRWLDEQLDQVLDRSYEAIGARSGGGGAWRGVRKAFPLIPDREIRAVAELQMDAALLFEGVTNALKLIGDPYLARLYRMAAQRMRIPEWHAGIQRKLQVAESIHEKLSEEAARRRLEVLEWIIIVLITISIATVFL